MKYHGIAKLHSGAKTERRLEPVDANDLKAAEKLFLGQLKAGERLHSIWPAEINLPPMPDAQHLRHTTV